MSFFKTLMDSFSTNLSSVVNSSATEKKNDRRYDEEFTDCKDNSSLINYLTKQYIDNELTVDKSKNHWKVFSQHRKPLIHCLKRYEDASLRQSEALQKEQAAAMLKALQQGKELSEHSGNSTIIERDDFVNGLKKITLTYCQKHVLTMADFLDNIPDHLCDGKNASTSWQSFRKDTSKKRWKNFDQACRDNSLYFFTGKVLFDTTLWGSGKHGIMLGLDDITCLGGKPDKFRILWSNVTSLWHHKGYLYVNDYKTGFVANDDACKLLELLEEHFDKMKHSEGNLLLEYLGYDRASQQAIKNAYEADVQQFIE
ncbi:MULTISPECIES: hypothetical protein [Providencia]|uniref:hypothetical protein n=1 Tax=Providencia TaxID=586 RepID=UPI001B389DF2|nr:MULTISPECIES: hypothetical protein [Providencia]MBQ0368301.1 hypothetical protein [Providencia rettgeri]MBQ0399825.1 hypothetical protein [Providencia rettgeri]